MTRTLRIGGAAGFWGDTPEGALQVANAGVDVIIFDYLAEVTMAILARARSKNPELGYATDFVDPVMIQLLPQVCGRGLKVVANAGGMNPRACRDAVLGVAEKLGLSPRVAIVTGDDLIDRTAELAAMGLHEIDKGTPFPDKPWSVNAYLGALPIAKALAAGADIVITGRCVDSALVLGPLIAEFGWSAGDYDRLAAGSLAGHVIECGCQATGGNFSDWQEVPGWENMGFPIAECAADGSFVVTKPEGTGGLVTPLSVGEQVVYEIGDPGRYILPDVVCDFTEVRLETAGPDRVLVTGARGRAPTPDYKVSTTFLDGYRSTAMFTLVGPDAVGKAKRVGEAIIARTRRLMTDQNFGDYRRTSIKLLGSEHQYGDHANPALAASREIVLRLDVHHDVRDALAIFAREIAPAGLAMAPGRCGLFGGRPRVTPIVGHRAFLVPKTALTISIDIAMQRTEIYVPAGEPLDAAPGIPAEPPGTDSVRTKKGRLYDIACARSGDKGDNVNIGVIAREPAFAPLIRLGLTPERVRDYFGDLVRGTVRRFELPGMNAFNFVLTEALDGGGTSSLRNDTQGKSFAQMLLDIEIEVPESIPSAPRKDI